MARVITFLIFLVCGTLTAQSQYEQGMQKAFGLWGSGMNDEASAMFERIAAAEKDNWLPNYYVALINTIQAFESGGNAAKVNTLLTRAQAAQDNAMAIAPDNPELLVMQAMIHTAWIAADPATNGRKLSGKVQQIYKKAIALAPDNPRVVFSKAEFDMGMASYFGNDTKPICAEIEKAVGLFATFKPESAFHPDWGKDRAEEALKGCKQ